LSAKKVFQKQNKAPCIRLIRALTDQGGMLGRGGPMHEGLNRQYAQFASCVNKQP